jgi:hypothetical protein
MTPVNQVSSPALATSQMPGVFRARTWIDDRGAGDREPGDSKEKGTPSRR